MGLRRWLRGPGAAGADDAVVVDADGDRLRVAEAVRRGVAAGAALSPLSAVTGSNQSSRPVSASCGSRRRPRRVSSVDPTRPV
jgi:hypothetical protein